ncbi:tripeptidyl-peptidase sed1 [Apiospora rasikravindrae]|uniref:Tripeptidyl-peptidase sed1 n=1 Tax=Apiospora rasikravindrae TaxID=990691 RepID=A0ABR1SVZ3_9PEZI
MSLIVFFLACITLIISGVSLTPLPDSGRADSGPSFSPATRRAIPHDHVKHERRTVEQGRRWVKLKRADAQATLPMRIGLKQQNLEKGHDLLMDISDPTSKNYGKHLTSTEVADFFAPSNTSVVVVKDWLVEAGIPASTISQSLNRQWIQFDVPVHQAEDLLATDYHIYEHEDSGVQTVACEEYHVPEYIQEHIDYITPGIKLMGLGENHDTRGKAKKRNTYRGGESIDRFILPVKMSDPSRLKIAVNQTGAPNDGGPSIPWNIPFPLDGDCDKYITPECIRRIAATPCCTKAHPGNKMGIFQGLGQKYTQHDLDTFFHGFTDGVIPNGTHPELRSINGGLGVTTDPRLAGSEANLDFQMAYGLIWPQQTVLYSVDDEYYQDSQAGADSPYKGFFNNLWNAIDGSYCSASAFGETGNCDRPECLDPSYPNNHTHGRDGYQGPLMCGTYERTNVITISYSGGEADLPYSYQRRQCAEIMKLALQGTTVLVGSGDDGVASAGNDPAPNGCLGPDHDVFHPQFLSTCPYVLSVGSTLLPPGRKPDGDNDGDDGSSSSPGCGATNKTKETPETPTVRFPSGGGFSNIYPRPPWQDRHVENYFAQVNLSFTGYDGGRPREGFFIGDPITSITASVIVNATGDITGPGRYNRIGRAYPDVAANGDNFVMSHRGELVRIGGTSASCPLFGSLLNLINEERIAAGKRGTVGFVNPVLYAHPEVFRDVVTGGNRGCGAGVQVEKGLQGTKKPIAFPAAPGWDPVSGLGTPDFPKMLELFMSLP